MDCLGQKKYFSMCCPRDDCWLLLNVDHFCLFLFPFYSNLAVHLRILTTLFISCMYKCNSTNQILPEARTNKIIPLVGGQHKLCPLPTGTWSPHSSWTPVSDLLLLRTTFPFRKQKRKTHPTISPSTAGRTTPPPHLTPPFPWFITMLRQNKS